MKRPLTHSFPMKVLAFLLAVASFVVSFCSVSVIAAMIAFRGYEAARVTDVTDRLLENYYSRYFNYVAQRYYEGGRAEADEYAARFGFYYSIEDLTGAPVASNFSGQRYRVKIQQLVRDVFIAEEPLPPVKEENEPLLDGTLWEGMTGSYVPTAERYTAAHCYVTIYGADEPQTANWQVGLRLVEIGWQARYFSIGALVTGGVLLITMVIFLFAASGRRKDRDEPIPNFADRIPLEIYTALYGGIGIALCLSARGVYRSPEQLYLILSLILVVLLATAFFVFALTFGLSLGTRIKTGTFWKNTLIYRLFRLISRLFDRIKLLFVRMKTVPRIAVLTGVFTAFSLLAALIVFRQTGTLFWLGFVLLELGVAVPLVAYLTSSVEKVRQDLEIMARGHFEHRCDPATLSPSVRPLGEEINRVGAGLENAVREKVKSERFRTELITNVSHDIKTPLTSIVNFVDLIRKEEEGNEKVLSYLDVLERQSNRLKKLTEDLVEASKASTGSLTMRFETLDLRVLVDQALGEYREAFEKKKLTPVFTAPPMELPVSVDGRYLWRVLDNLMNNALKYSVPNTRFYCTLGVEGAFVSLTLLNISLAPLNISPEELMERFVRGDASRNTEGSGLGLSIARSLVELQHGIFEVSIDGDLFKVRIRFPRQLQTPPLSGTSPEEKAQL